jgi:hypothetical protein
MQNYLKENKSIIAELFESIIFFSQCEFIFEFIKPEYFEKLLDSMLRTFKLKDCCEHNIFTVEEEPHEKNKQGEEQDISSIEYHIIFAIHVWCKTSKTERSFQVIQEMLLFYTEFIEQRNGKIDPRPNYELDSNELAEFIEVLSTNKIPISEKLFVLLEPYFLRVDGLNNYKNAIIFIKMSPYPISENILINLKKQFEEYYQYYLRELNPKYVLEYDSLVMPFEDEINRHIGLLKEIGEFFDIDISQGICKLEAIKIKLEEIEAESINDPDLAYESWRDDKAIYDEEEEIDKIFSYLDD